MTDLGNLNFFLGVSITWDANGMFLSQCKYALDILKRANMLNCKPVHTPTDTLAKLDDSGQHVEDPTLYHHLALMRFNKFVYTCMM